MKAVAVIPARYASSRFPGKPLARQTGKYLIQHVVERVSAARSISEIVVATDDRRIFDAVVSFGGRAAMTREDHPSGTDRVAEVAATLDAELIVNVQGDEPEIDPASIDRLVTRMASDSQVPIGTLACPFSADADPRDSNAVKVVVDQRGRALYFSRSLIPYPRESMGAPDSAADWLLHVGIYAYRRDFLFTLAGLPPTPLEQIEKLEQLRVLENGYPIAVTIVSHAAAGIDTPEDYAAFVARLAQA
ncbi:MAG TPA: 3-deoxy-manno-octulosonate cytidylyltransferase [Phycisphaerae bacterium]|nr:3-deoxy-manno-octulosonate cytidylyltransferase [Phycisphaerae bacterium]